MGKPTSHTPFQEKYMNNNIQHFVFANNKIEKQFHKQLQMPKKFVVIQGSAGTGKTCLAETLIDEYIKVRNISGYKRDFHSQRYATVSDFSAEIQRLPEQSNTQHYNGANSHFFSNNFVIYDRYDRCSQRLQEEINHCYREVTEFRAVFIVSDLNKVNSDIKNQSLIINLPHLNPEQFLPVLSRVMHGESIKITTGNTLKIIKRLQRCRSQACYSYFDELEDLVFTAKNGTKAQLAECTKHLRKTYDNTLAAVYNRRQAADERAVQQENIDELNDFNTTCDEEGYERAKHVVIGNQNDYFNDPVAKSNFDQVIEDEGW